MSEFLENLKIGDEVAQSIDHGRDYQIYTVARLTKTQIVIHRHYSDKFNRKNGHEVGRRAFSHSGGLQQVTPEIKDIISRNKVITTIRNKVEKVERILRQENKNKLNLNRLIELVNSLNKFLESVEPTVLPPEKSESQVDGQ